jgi:hypothetical protein
VQQQRVATRSDLDALLKRIESGQLAESDIETLRWLLTASEQTVLQVGKYGVNLGQGQDVHVGERITNGLSLEDIRGVVQEVLSFQKQTISIHTKQTESELEDETLALLELEIETQIIKQINLQLLAINEVQNAVQLTAHQKAIFRDLKGEVQSLNCIDKTLKNIATKSTQLLQEAIYSLAKKLQELKDSQPESFAEAKSQQCLMHQMELLQQLQIELEQGQEVARWIDLQKSALAERLGQYALNAYPTIKEAASPKQIKAFYFSIKQFLERLSHCLIWGRTDSLKTTKTPVVLDDKVYETAFNYLRKTISESDDDLPEEGIEQLNEYIDCLLRNFPQYQHISLS